MASNIQSISTNPYEDCVFMAHFNKTTVSNNSSINYSKTVLQVDNTSGLHTQLLVSIKEISYFDAKTGPASSSTSTLYRYRPEITVKGYSYAEDGTEAETVLSESHVVGDYEFDISQYHRVEVGCYGYYNSKLSTTGTNGNGTATATFTAKVS